MSIRDAFTGATMTIQVLPERMGGRLTYVNEVAHARRSVALDEKQLATLVLLLARVLSGQDL
jgi:hypothetical protein